MRQDMQKVLLDAGRTRPGRAYRARVDWIEGEAICAPRESMRRAYTPGYSGMKESLFSARLLYRFLDSRVGTSWDTVYSEIRQTLKGPKAEDSLRRIHQDVAVDTFQGGDVIMVNTSFAGVQEASRYFDYFVHPTTRILMAGDQGAERAKWSRMRREREADALLARRRTIDATHQAHKVDGIWYVVELKPLPALQWVSHMEKFRHGKGMYGTRSLVNPGYTEDAVLGAVSDYGRDALYRQYGVRDVFGATKRQMNHRELQQLGLSN